jgi:hypothetical protein
MTANIPNIKAFVQEKYLYDMDETKLGFVECGLIGIITYHDQTPTFHIITNANAIYSDIPFHAISFKAEVIDKPLELSDLVYNNCKTLEIDVFTLTYLQNSNPICFFRKKNLWLEAKYLFSVDFYTGNDLFHVMKLNNNQLAAVPNHKVNWGGDAKLADYKKSHSNWNL